MRKTIKKNNWLRIGIWLLIALIPVSAIGATTIKSENNQAKVSQKNTEQDTEKEVVLTPTFEAVISVATVWVLLANFYFLNLQRPVIIIFKPLYIGSTPFNHAFFSKIFCKLIVTKGP